MASLVFLALVTLIFAPIVLVLARRRGGSMLAGLLASALVAVAIVHTGWGRGAGLGRSDLAGLDATAPDEARCREAIRLLSEAGIVRKDASGALSVQPAIWAQLPQDARTMIEPCLSANAIGTKAQ